MIASPQRRSPISSRLATIAERWTLPALALFSIGYLVLMIRFAPRRTMWIDEYLTLYLSRLSLPEMWKALLTGAESHPPTFLALTQFSTKLCGAGPLGLRLPAILGILLMELCVFRFVARQTSRLVAFTAMLVPFTTRATSYALEARGYGLLLGLTALALVCWQEACDGRRRGLASIGLAVTLAAATACHYFGALVVLPLAAAEAVRTIGTRRIAWGIWMAFAAPALPLALFLPLIRASRSYTTHHGLLNAEFQYYSFLLRDGHALLLVVLAAIAVYALMRRPDEVVPPRSSDDGFRLHEAVAIGGFLLLPVVVYVTARTLHMPFADRYVLCGAIAVSALVAMVIDAMPDRNAVAVLVLAGLAVWAGSSYVFRATRGPVSEPDDRYIALHGKPGLPVAVSDIDTLSRMQNSASPELAGRLVYLTDRDLAFRYLGHDTADRIMEDLRPWMPLHSEPFCRFAASTPEFLVYGPVDAFMNWLSRALVDDTVTLQVLGLNQDRWLVAVRRTGASPFCQAPAGSR
jgi:hypothetical protein